MGMRQQDPGHALDAQLRQACPDFSGEGLILRNKLRKAGRVKWGSISRVDPPLRKNMQLVPP